MRVQYNTADFFLHRHDVYVNQKYGENDSLPYSFHLKATMKFGDRFIHLLPNELHSIVKKALPAHDAIEDARMTHNDIKTIIGPEAAKIVFLCTDFRGMNRDERKPIEYYEQLRDNLGAVFVKLCDIMANLSYGIMVNSSMTKKYKEEYYRKTQPYLFKDELSEMFLYIEKMLELV